MARHVGRKTIRVPTIGSGDPAHSPERISTTQGMWAVSADFYAIGTNTGTLYIGWAGTSGVLGLQTAIPIVAGDVVTLENPVRDADGNLVPFDLYDVFVSGAVNGDGLTFFTW